MLFCCQLITRKIFFPWVNNCCQNLFTSFRALQFTLCGNVNLSYGPSCYKFSKMFPLKKKNKKKIGADILGTTSSSILWLGCKDVKQQRQQLKNKNEKKKYLRTSLHEIWLGNLQTLAVLWPWLTSSLFKHWKQKKNLLSKLFNYLTCCLQQKKRLLSAE